MMGDPQLPLLIPTYVDPTPDRTPGRRPSKADAGILSALPPDLLDQIRGRLRLIALLLFIGFAFDPLLYAGQWLVLRVRHQEVPQLFHTLGYLQLAYVGGALSSAALWWLAFRPRVSPSRLLTIGLWYEVAVCFVSAFTSNLEYYLSYHILPGLVWVPAIVIFFPLVLPGPPRRMLFASIVAASTTPFSILLLAQTGLVEATPGIYISVVVHGVFAVLFASIGSRVVYGMGKEVLRARELGSYRLGDLLGRGGMGEVYRATHRMLARPAAIKLIRPEMLDGADPGGAEMAIRRFRQEAEVAASLRSPHTVELYDFGVTADRTFYFVMELLEGIDLESLVRQKGPLPAGRVIYLLRQVCESLEEAHARDLVHRDIKPANIHVGRLGLRYDFVKVLDFGLVKSLNKQTRSESLATEQGLIAGTPGYMAPELAVGEHFDGRADVYAVGCVAYYLLTGRTVFEAPTAIAMLAKHLRDEPVPPSRRTELTVPADLEGLVLRCLDKRADKRPGAEALSGELGRIDRAPWTQAQARQWWATNKPA